MWQEIVHTIPGPGRVDADFGDLVIPTDHPPAGEREGRAPEPWLLFLTSIGTCMASFVDAYCRENGLPAEEVRLIQRHEVDEETGEVGAFLVEVEVPATFTLDQAAAVAEAAEACTVKRVIEAGPRFEVSVTARERPSQS